LESRLALKILEQAIPYKSISMHVERNCFSLSSNRSFRMRSGRDTRLWVPTARSRSSTLRCADLFQVGLHSYREGRFDPRGGDSASWRERPNSPVGNPQFQTSAVIASTLRSVAMNYPTTHPQQGVTAIHRQPRPPSVICLPPKRCRPPRDTVALTDRSISGCCPVASEYVAATRCENG
jgi:hypothetical protein